MTTQCCGPQFAFGSSVLLYANFFNDAGQPADPTNVTLRVLDPDGNESEYTLAQLTKTAVGCYQIAIDAAVTGVWFFRYEGAGAVDIAQESQFIVAASQFADAA